MSDKKPDDNEKFHFNPVNKKEIPSILKEIHEENPEILLWKKGDDDHKETYSIQHLDDASLTLTLKIKGSFLDLLKKSKLAGNKVLCKLPMEKIIYFSEGNFEYNEKEQKYQLQIDGAFYRSQKRKDYRLKRSRIVTLKIKIGDKVFDCEDVSAGGASFLLTATDLVPYPKGSEFKQCELQVNKNRYLIPTLKIAAHIDTKVEDATKGKIFKIGVQFLGLSPSLDEKLSRDITGEARAQEMLKKFS